MKAIYEGRLVNIKCRLLAILLLSPLVLFGRATSAQDFDHDHSKWTKILKAYLDPQGLVHYKSLQEAIANGKAQDFPVYLNEIQAVRLGSYNGWTKNQQLAFLINAYNALTVRLILNNYPISSIKKIGGFFTKAWDVEFFNLLEGQLKSLDPIEHKWIRPKFKDYRIHAAVNCASISCPRLRSEAYVASSLDRQLNEQMKEWLGDSTRNVIDLANNKIEHSQIFSWYKDDFNQWGGGMLQVISKHLSLPISKDQAKKLKIKTLTYNWLLNEAKDSVKK